MPPRADHAQRTQRRGRGGGSAPTRAQASVPPPGEVLTSTIKRKKKRLKGFRHCLCQDALCLELRKRPEMLPNKMVLLPTGDKGVFSTRAMVQAFGNIPERCGNHATEKCDCTGDPRLQAMMQGVKHCCLIDDACDCLTVTPPPPPGPHYLVNTPRPTILPAEEAPLECLQRQAAQILERAPSAGGQE